MPFNSTCHTNDMYPLRPPLFISWTDIHVHLIIHWTQQQQQKIEKNIYKKIEELTLIVKKCVSAELSLKSCSRQLQPASNT